MMKENEDGGVHLVGSVDCGGRTPFCAAARGAVCGGVKEKKRLGKKWEWEWEWEEAVRSILARAN